MSFPILDFLHGTILISHFSIPEILLLLLLFNIYFQWCNAFVDLNRWFQVNHEKLSDQWRAQYLHRSSSATGELHKLSLVNVLLFRTVAAIFSPHDSWDDNRHVICITDLNCQKKYMFIRRTTLSGDCKWFAIYLQLSFWQFVLHRRSFKRFTKMGVSFICKCFSFWTVSLLSNDVKLHSQRFLLHDFLFLETANHS